MDPLQLLRDDLHDSDYEQSITAVQRLSTIAFALGPARTRNELIPFLLEYADQDNDEGLTIIGNQLGDFHELVGGSAHVPVLLPLLEKLSGQEEFVVRDSAVKAICKLAAHLHANDVATKIVPLIRRLANGGWFTTRVSASSLFTPAYPHLTAQLKDELRALFTNLCNDDTPMVRKAAYKSMGDFGAVLSKEHFKTDMIPILKAVVQDDVDTMRLEALSCCVTIAGKVDPAEFATSILEILTNFSDDTSWRVRKHMAENFPALCNNVDEKSKGSKLVPLFTKFLIKEKEAEVRTAAAGMLGAVGCECKSGIEHIIPCLEVLASDPVPSVRVALSKTLVALAGPMGKEQGQKLLIPIINLLVKDENQEVRNNIIESIEPLLEHGLTALLPVISDLAQDPKWRVRAAVVDKCTIISKQLGPKGYEKSKLQDILVKALSDHIYRIRETSSIQIGLLVQQFGGKWAEEKLFPQAFQLYDKQTNYIHRMTCLLVCQQCVQVAGSEVVEKTLLPIVELAVGDDVPNVRLAAAQVLNLMCTPDNKSLVANKIQPLLKKLTEDSDGDVVFFARIGLKACVV